MLTAAVSGCKKLVLAADNNLKTLKILHIPVTGSGDPVSQLSVQEGLLKVVLLAFHQGELLHCNRASFLLEGMKEQYQRGHSLKQQEHLNFISVSVFIVHLYRVVWRAWVNVN
jgi:hypothetical protein